MLMCESEVCAMLMCNPLLFILNLSVMFSVMFSCVLFHAVPKLSVSTMLLYVFSLFPLLLFCFLR